MTRQGIAFKPPAVYILESEDQDEGVGVMMQRREMTRPAGASQKIEHKPRASEAVRAVVIFSNQAGEIWGKLFRRQVAFKCALKLYDRVSM